MDTAQVTSEPEKPIPAQTLTPEQQQTIDQINAMSHYDMCRLWRHSPPGHPYFDSTLPYADVFTARLFGHFGGFTPELSKSIGWQNQPA